MLVRRQADGRLIDLGGMMLKLMDGHLGRTCTHLFLAGEEGELGEAGVAGSKDGEEDGGLQALGAGIRGRLVLGTPLLHEAPRLSACPPPPHHILPDICRGPWQMSISTGREGGGGVKAKCAHRGLLMPLRGWCVLES